MRAACMAGGMEGGFPQRFVMLATLAVLGFLVGMPAWYQSRIVAFRKGAILVFASCPWTIFVIMRINKRLMTTPVKSTGVATRALSII